MSDDDQSTAGPRLDEVAAYLRGLGLAEHGDFYVRGRLPNKLPSSEHVAISDRDGVFKVWSRDLGSQRVHVETTDFDEARNRFVAEAIALARQRGRELREDRA